METRICTSHHAMDLFMSLVFTDGSGFCKCVRRGGDIIQSIHLCTRAYLSLLLSLAPAISCQRCVSRTMHSFSTSSSNHNMVTKIRIGSDTKLSRISRCTFRLCFPKSSKRLFSTAANLSSSHDPQIIVGEAPTYNKNPRRKRNSATVAGKEPNKQ